MSLNARDPQFGVKLTAYALGELGEKERQEVELELVKSPELQRELHAIREVTGLLKHELERETGPGLTREQRLRISSRPESAASRLAERLQGFWKILTPSRLIPALAIGALAFGYFGPFSSLRERKDIIEPPARTSVAERPIEALSQPADLAPALQSEEAREAKAKAPEPVTPRMPPRPEALRKKEQSHVLESAADSAPPARMAPATNSFASGGGLGGGMSLGMAGAPKGAAAPAESAAAPAEGSPAMDGAGAPAGTRGAVYNLTSHAKSKRTEPSAPKKADLGDTEAYDGIVENEFKTVTQEPLSTFSIDVDTASYSNVRRYLNAGSLPPKDAVRIEELVNYFPYNYESPQAGSNDPFAVNVEVGEAPWNHKHQLVRIGLKGRELESGQRPRSNLVFLIDVSGSMNQPNKLPWIKSSLKILTERLGENDTVSIVVYAGNTGLLLPPTRGTEKRKIIEAIEHMKAGGSTNGGKGIELAYKIAQENFVTGGTNRVILTTDGDFNVGVTTPGGLTRLIEKKARSGVALSVLGFGMGNLKDATMEKLADKGHGHYAYVDSLKEARKLFVEEMGSTLVTIARDVKAQVEFNPAEVGAYRLIGYEKRVMAHPDFNDDTKSAGDLGAGHTVTALYEVVPKGVSIDAAGVDPLKYQQNLAPAEPSKSGELMTLKVRYKTSEAKDGASKLMTFPIKPRSKDQERSTASKDFKFQSAVAAFGMLLRDSKFKGQANYDLVIDLAESGRGEDKQGYRAELIELARKARGLSSGSPASASPSDQ